jgi:anaerobic magnesium-protoporphyrin IX monomethyl ester cyclase
MNLLEQRRTDPSFLLAYPPLQYASDEMVRPDGTLGPPYLDAALTEAGFSSRLLDMSIGTERDALQDTFHRQVELEPGLVRVGMSPERILEEVAEVDVVGITSLFTQQTSRCLEVIELIKRAFPDKIAICGGVNARNLRDPFFRAGADAIFLSESEIPIVQFARYLHSGKPDLSEIEGIAYRLGDRVRVNPARGATRDLDLYPMPSWHKLPNQRYWEIGRVWGGKDGWMEGIGNPRYAAIFTSRGCPFRCHYCHISLERGHAAGDIGNLRLHSVERVERELDTLRELGVEFLFINDDSFLAKKRRVFQILELLKSRQFKLADVNGVNILHLFKRHHAELVVDEDLLHALFEAGFRKISLPFESGTQRLLDKYSTSKWRLSDCNIEALIRALHEVGMVADGNFMIGYPDETLDELTDTFLLARRGMDAGLVGCQFFMVQPFPGTALFEECIENGQLKKTWHWDQLGWSKGSPYENPVIDRDLLKYTWSLVWKLLNKQARVEEFTDQLVSKTGRDPS